MINDVALSEQACTRNLALLQDIELNPKIASGIENEIPAVRMAKIADVRLIGNHEIVTSFKTS